MRGGRALFGLLVLVGVAYSICAYGLKSGECESRSAAGGQGDRVSEEKAADSNATGEATSQDLPRDDEGEG